MGRSRFLSKLLVKGLASLVLVIGVKAATAQSEWLTWGHDPERTASNPDEKSLNKDNVSQLELKWTAQISTDPKESVLSTMTAPSSLRSTRRSGPPREFS